MNQDEINSIARAEGLIYIPQANSPLVRIVRKALEKEREACAQIAEEWLGPVKDREMHIAAAIRSRGQKEGV